MPAYRELPLNEKGRDFVVGDIHGCFHLLEAALEQVHFDTDCDRVFATGDLVDRGPHSIHALDYLRKNWFYAVRGNHDQDFADYMFGRDDHQPEYWVRNGDKVQLHTLAELIDRLPAALSVRTAMGLQGIVHVQVPRGLSWPVFIRRLNDNDKEALQTPVRGAYFVQDRRPAYVHGVSRVFAGHSGEVHGIRRAFNTVYIDTLAVSRLSFDASGAPKWLRNRLGLTMIDMSVSDAALAAPKKHDGVIDVRLS